MFLTRLTLGLGRFLADGGEAAETNADADKLIDSIYNLLFDSWVKGLILGAVALFAIIKGVMIGIGIVQAADNESEKAQKIKALKTLIIGVAIVLVLYFAAQFIFGMIKNGL